MTVLLTNFCWKSPMWQGVTEDGQRRLDCQVSNFGENRPERLYWNSSQRLMTQLEKLKSLELN